MIKAAISFVLIFSSLCSSISQIQEGLSLNFSNNLICSELLLIQFSGPRGFGKTLKCIKSKDTIYYLSAATLFVAYLDLDHNSVLLYLTRSL
jgi:hypothetical protein